MWRVIVIIVSLVAAGCLGTGGKAGHGGFTGTDARWYDVAYKRCAAEFKHAEENPGHSLDFLFETPKEAGHQKAVTAGCTAAGKDAGIAFGSLYETTP
jgi:hypothetical protein